MGFPPAGVLWLGFQAEWVRLVMHCVESASFSVLVNGVPSHIFQPSPSLRDSLIFLRDTFQATNQLMQILDLYEQSTGQKVNFNKLTVFFSPSISPHRRNTLQRVLGIRCPLSDDKYLGFPWMLGHRENDQLEYLIDRATLSQAGRATLIKSVV